MPPRPRESSGYRSVRTRPSDTFYVKIRFDEMRLGLDTFDNAAAGVRTYNAAAWRLRRPRREMNFYEVMTRVQRLAPSSRLVTEEDRCENRGRKRCLGIAEMDEQAWQRGANSFHRTSSTSVYSSHKGGRNEPPIARTRICRSRPRSSTSSSKKR
ncbi:Ethylene-responsive transcription factor CRF1 [Hordeum vulgare]|nr:Ethylene-responsive transcription factor CRF1 [Hordeum vulgare]